MEKVVTRTLICLSVAPPDPTHTHLSRLLLSPSEPNFRLLADSRRSSSGVLITFSACNYNVCYNEYDINVLCRFLEYQFTELCQTVMDTPNGQKSVLADSVFQVYHTEFSLSNCLSVFKILFSYLLKNR